MAKVEVKFKRGTQQELDAMPIVDGQLLWNTETGETFQDVNGKRELTGRKSASSGVSSVNGKTGVVTLSATDISATVPAGLPPETPKTTQGVMDALAAQSVVIPQMFGAVGDGVADDTDALQRCVDFAAQNKKTMYIPQGVYLVNVDKHVNVKSNMQIVMDYNATVKAKASAKDYTSVFSVSRCENVLFYGGNIVGDRTIHTGSGGEHGMGINIVGSSNITVDSVTISNCWGDAVYAGADEIDGHEKSANVTVKNCFLHHCRRQGVSVVGCDGFLCESCIINDIGGTNPEGAIDLESNFEAYPNTGIVICNVQSKNSYGGMLVSTNTKDADIKNCTFDTLYVKKGGDTVKVSKCEFRSHVSINIADNQLFRLNKCTFPYIDAQKAQNVELFDCVITPGDVPTFDWQYSPNSSLSVNHCVISSGDKYALCRGIFKNIVIRDSVIIQSGTLSNAGVNATDSVVYSGNTFIFNAPNGEARTQFGGSASVYYINNIVDVSSIPSLQNYGLIMLNNSGEAKIVGTTVVSPNTVPGQEFIRSNDATARKLLAANNVIPQYYRLGVFSGTTTVREQNNIIREA